jgi:hypothetical protein
VYLCVSSKTTGLFKPRDSAIIYKQSRVFCHHTCVHRQLWRGTVMGRIIEEKTWQKRTVAFICAVGIAHCIICILPAIFNVSLFISTVEILTVAHSASHVAAVAASFPLICDYVCDFSLPQNLTYPRGLFMVALLVPSAVILSMTTLQGPCVRISVCLHYASAALFNAGTSAFLAGEVGDKRLLLLLALETVCSSVRNLSYVHGAFISPTNGPRIFLIATMCYAIIYLTMLVLLVLHVKTLNERRKHFIKVYLTSFVAYLILRVGSLVTLHALDLVEYAEDATLLIQILITTGVSLATSRMGQHDAIVAQVSKANRTAQLSPIPPPLSVQRTTY